MFGFVAQHLFVEFKSLSHRHILRNRYLLAVFFRLEFTKQDVWVCSTTPVCRVQISPSPPHSKKPLFISGFFSSGVYQTAEKGVIA